MRITHVKIHSPNLDEQRRFYTEALGLPLTTHTDDHFTVRVGYSLLAVHAIETPQVHHITFNIAPQHFEGALAWVQTHLEPLPFRGEPYIDFSATSWKAKSVYFLDSAGNVLEFIARCRLSAPNAPQSFSPAAALGISEVGLASEDLPELAAALQLSLELPPFDGDAASGFVALGDDHGLFVCADVGRPWLPTDDRLAGLYPVEVTLSGGPATTVQIPGHPYRISRTG